MKIKYIIAPLDKSLKTIQHKTILNFTTKTFNNEKRKLYYRALLFISLGLIRKFIAYQLFGNFELRADLLKIIPLERARKTKSRYLISSDRYSQVLSKIFLKYIF